ncbi:MAG: hypothetical protein LBN30_06600 [Oscillospiraceae bacterium]|jgi:hypothetical protein|nr:hypothetical protein [Oscillospiraceae bacterium]
MKKTRIIIVAAIFIALVLGTGAVMLAAGNYGSQEDPLITMSYLNDKFKPELLAALAEEITKAQAEVDAQLNQKLAELSGATPAPVQTVQTAPETFELVTLTANQTVKCAVGTELLLRIGTANGTGSSPALIDSTTGDTLASGASLAANHMYMATIADNGITATSDTVKLLIRGDYTIS